MSRKRFSLLLCTEDSEYIVRRYGGYFGVFVSMFGEEDETWDVYRVSRGEFPNEEEIEECDGFVISGSCSDAHGDDVWISKLCDLLRKLDFLKKKVLGICFGHQILCRALGGKTGRSETGWDIGIRTIHLSSSSKLLRTQKLPPLLSVIECHRDEVKEVPFNAKVIGWSNKTRIEMFNYGDHIMGIQGHPEYTKDILLHLIDRLLQHNFIEDSYANEMKASVEICEPDRTIWRKLCINFLKIEL